MGILLLLSLSRGGLPLFNASGRLFEPGKVDGLGSNKALNIGPTETQKRTEFNGANAGMTPGSVIPYPAFRHAEAISDLFRAVEPLGNVEFDGLSRKIFSEIADG
jgi:hypothetical protein